MEETAPDRLPGTPRELYSSEHFTMKEKTAIWTEMNLRQWPRLSWTNSKDFAAAYSAA